MEKSNSHESVVIGNTIQFYNRFKAECEARDGKYSLPKFIQDEHISETKYDYFLLQLRKKGFMECIGRARPRYVSFKELTEADVKALIIDKYSGDLNSDVSLEVKPISVTSEIVAPLKKKAKFVIILFGRTIVNR